MAFRYLANKVILRRHKIAATHKSVDLPGVENLNKIRPRLECLDPILSNLSNRLVCT